MVRLFRPFTIALIMIFLPVAPIEGQEWSYVQSSRAPLFAEPSFRSPLLAEVKRGHRLGTMDSAGNWVKVRHGSRDAYVPALLLAPHHPREAPSFRKDRADQRQRDFRRRASAYQKQTEDRKQPDLKADYRAIEKMEAFTVRDDEVRQFGRER